MILSDGHFTPVVSQGSPCRSFSWSKPSNKTKEPSRSPTLPLLRISSVLLLTLGCTFASSRGYSRLARTKQRPSRCQEGSTSRRGSRRSGLHPWPCRSPTHTAALCNRQRGASLSPPPRGTALPDSPSSWVARNMALPCISRDRKTRSPCPTGAEST